MGLNDDLFDQLTRHQIGLNRLASGTVDTLVAKLDEYDRRITELTRKITAETSRREVERILREIQKINEAAYLAVAQVMEREMFRTAQHEVAYQGDTIVTRLRREVLGDLDVRGPSNHQLDDLVKSTAINGAVMSEYVDGMEQGRMRRIREAVRREHAAGGPAVQDGIRRAVEGSRPGRGQDGVLGLSRRSLDQTTRTIQTGVVAAARDEFYAENDELFAGEQWVALLETKTCPICGSLDGTVFPVGEGPRPPAHPNCRCYMTPIVKDWEELGLEDLGPGTRESMDGEVPETMTYEQWLRRQPAGVQDEALGPARGQLFREGVGVDRFVDETGQRYTLDELASIEGLAGDYPPGVLASSPEAARRLTDEWAQSAPLQGIDEIYEHAQGNQDLLAGVMGTAAADLGLEFANPGVKGMERTMEKLADRTPAQLTDIVRGGVVVEGPAQADELVRRLGEEFQVADEGWTTTPVGYFDRKALVRFPNGQVGEVQFWEENLLEVKERGGGHDLYVQARSLPKDDPRLAELEQQMRDLYGGVTSQLSGDWKDAVGR